MGVIDKIKLDGTTYDVGKTPDTTLAVSGSPADAAKVGTELDKKVDKVTGKGLSTEDFTTAEKTKLAEIAEGATKITIDDTLTQSGQGADAKLVGNHFKLYCDEIPNTVQEFVFEDGIIKEIQHKHNNVVVRQDVYTFNDASIVEKRTLSTGESLTITVDLTTLETTITEV